MFKCKKGTEPLAPIKSRLRHLAPSGISGHGHYYPIPPPQPGAVQQQSSSSSLKWFVLVGLLLVVLLVAFSATKTQ